MSSDKELCIQGWKYQFGIDVEKDLEKAFDFYKQAADLGDGIHVKKDRNKASEYFQKSASTGFEMGIIKKALCYRYGYGTQESNDYFEKLFNTLNIRDPYCYAFAYGRDENYKICENCNENYTKLDWCQMCNPDILIQNWTSNNKDIDDLMKILQLKCYNDRIIAWISYDCLTDIKEIGRGGHATVYKARFLGGIIFKVASDESKRNVALKTVNLQEFENHVNCNSNFCAPYVYGLTLNPKTGEYIMVFQYAEDEDLVNYLKKNWQHLNWDKRIELLYLVSFHLMQVHELGLIHADLHSGNILCFGNEGMISDLGQSRKINENKEVYGVLPYVDPVILQGGKLAEESDIYGFGIIMWVIATGRQPYDGLNFDIDLSLQICQGLRPEFDNYLPKSYVELAVRCLNKNQEDRPTAEDIKKTVEEWRKNEEIMRQFKKADEYRPQLVEQIHPKEMFTSKLINVREISKRLSEIAIIPSKPMEYVNIQDDF
ncbi:kinase-like domain-containing protein [Gigaspora rosea]|uniref:Kinase-like domain-containing protein n=1 Tax=Gigaspora rosea TaxID=44941 RepID=A0A397WDZ9_9GLOM|nr:kinase-like domain-containing protein [Gigaspora rosea]